jgi:flagellar biosynthetic protein FliR
VNEPAAALLAILGGWAAAGGLVFLRVGAAMALLPGFSESFIPVRVRLGLALAFTAVVAPAVADRLPPFPQSPGGLIAIIGSETISGLALGFSLRLFIWLLHTAGSIAAQSTSLSQLLGGAIPEPQPAMARLMIMAGLALAAILGLHIRIAEALILSYDPLPAGVFPVAGDLSQWSVDRVASMFSLAFSFAAPFVIASLIYNVALGVINRAMPQLMVAFVGAPAITAGGLILLFVVLPLVLPLWHQHFAAQLAQPLGMPR